MKRINAKNLLNFSMAELWDILTGEFILVMDDGEIQTNHKETLYSAYSWDFHRAYPKTPLLLKHHVKTILGKGRLGSDTHLRLLGNAMWSTYDANVNSSGFETEQKFRDVLAKRIYELTNQMYNELTYRLEEYVMSLDITDFMQALKHPEIKKANDIAQAMFNDVSDDDLRAYATRNNTEIQKTIDNVYSVIERVLMDGVSLPNNPISMYSRSKLASMGQVKQCLGPRGYLTDTDSNTFIVPVMRGYGQSIRLFHDSFIESRSASKSLIFSKTPLQQAEYFSRRLQLMSQIVQNLHHGDCGSTEYLNWKVEGPIYEDGVLVQKSDLPKIAGKNFMDDDGVIKTIHANDEHLIGRTLKMRAVIHCAHPDPYGICTTCFGELSLSVPEGTNIGQMCCTSLAQQSSQNVLSVKHLDGSSVVDSIVIDPMYRDYLAVAKDNNSYLLSDSLLGKEVKLVIPSFSASNITDIMDVHEVTDLNITRVSELKEISIKVTHKGREEVIGLSVNLNRRLASMTYQLLAHIRANGWVIDARGNYVIDMTGWDWKQPILTLPLKHFNMSDHSRDIAALLESSVGKLQERDKNVSPDAVLLELYGLVNDKLNVNLAVLDVVLYGTMIVSAEQNNYNLPKPWTTSGLGVMKLSMAYRSLSAAMAYQGHADIITSPISYTLKNRADHPMDGLISPYEVVKYKHL